CRMASCWDPASCCEAAEPIRTPKIPETVKTTRIMKTFDLKDTPSGRQPVVAPVVSIPYFLIIEILLSLKQERDAKPILLVWGTIFFAFRSLVREDYHAVSF